ncbi:MAG: helix-turn-helix domain-containing protein [Acidobacteriia bacterium]|nr:helix-turn-helix domain-containing protein [Terriglobia bacterium]
MDLPSIIRQRLEQLGYEQRQLAVAAQVTESYISQLLTRKKAPPAPERTDIYGKIEEFLKFRRGELLKLVELLRQQELKRKLADPPAPLFKEVRELVLGKCRPDKQKQVRAIFERQPFGELELLVTQKILDVVKGVAKQELESENWLRLVGKVNGRSFEELRVAILEFLDTDVFNVSAENCTSFLDPLIESWDIDLATFSLEIVLNQRMVPRRLKKFAFVEQPETACKEEPGLKEFLQDASLSGGATDEEIEFLKGLRFKRRHPTALFYYRELQNLRDPLHFRGLVLEGRGAPESPAVPEQAGRSKTPLAP